jgi:S-DNA-T family DNA segregation ATPase FtsK/SpoIIIE
MTYSLNTLNTDRATAPPSGIRRFTQEMGLVVGLVLLVFALLALLTHHPADPAWSTTGQGGSVTNWAGRAGAYVSDMALYLFGLSTWWMVLVGVRVWLGTLANWLRTERTPEPPEAEGRWAWLQAAPLRRLGYWALFLALLVASMVLEWSRLYRLEAWLPGHAGGAFGYWLGPMAVRWLGFNGSALLALVVMVLASARVFQFSWGHWAESIGARLDGWWQARKDRREANEDAQIGRQAVRQREESVADWTEALPQHAAAPVFKEPTLDGPLAVAPTGPDLLDEVTPPWDDAPAKPGPASAAPHGARVERSLHIEPVAADIAVSERVVKERQKPLFSEMPDSHLPQVDLLDGPPGRQETVSPETLEMTSRLIEKKLSDFGVQVTVVAAAPGPVITRYEIDPATGVKGAQIVNLAKDLARSLSLVSIRVIETIPGKNTMALELPNAKRQTIRLSEILGSQVYNDAKSPLTMGLGKDIVGNPVVADLAKMPHCLVAGTTGSGKSVGINAMILSLLYKADAHDVRLMLIDPKMLEMSVYEGIPHLLCPVVTDMKQAANGLNWCVAEMEKRYKLMSKMGVRNLAGFNTKIDEAKARGEIIGNPFSLTPEQPEPLDRLPHIVVVIDELADLMMVVGKKIEELIARLAQKARAAGIHLILATQRPSVDVITGLIKANIPTRISFQVSSKIDSRTILDQMGAEALLGMGDMLYMPSGTGFPQRVHGAFVSDDEVHRVVAYLKAQGGEPNYIDGVLEAPVGDGDGFGGEADGGGGASGEKDPMYDMAVEIVLKDRKASISYVQRKLKIGYNRSARLLEDMEKAGLVSALTSSGQRDILVAPRAD